MAIQKAKQKNYPEKIKSKCVPRIRIQIDADSTAQSVRVCIKSRVPHTKCYHIHMWILCDSNDYAEFDLKISHFAVIFIDLFTSVSTDLEFLARKYRMAIE